jgi:hypothetical protein
LQWIKNYGLPFVRVGIQLVPVLLLQFLNR